MKKLKIQIRSWVNGAVLFEHESTDNTIRKTVEEAAVGHANLSHANLSYADLSSADLRSANLRYADLSSADLSHANLRYADLSSADLSHANLSYADLSHANLSYANLSSANLRSADLSSADLRSAENAEGAIAMTRILPDGDIIGWKKCEGDAIVKLMIPAKAKRSHAFGRKCRAEYAEVLKLYKTKSKVAVSKYDKNFTYKVGEIVRPTGAWDEDFTNECGSGIHFYITRLEAENHV